MTKKLTKRSSSLDVHYNSILGDISEVIELARGSAARSVNCIMTAAYWLIGRRIVEHEQGGKMRADYGEALLGRLSSDLAIRYGRGFGVDNLQRFRLFYLAYPPSQIHATLSRKSDQEYQTEKYATLSRISHVVSLEKADKTIHKILSDKLSKASEELSLTEVARSFPLPWSAYVRLLSVKNENARKFYETETIRCGWSVRQLDR